MADFIQALDPSKLVMAGTESAEAVQSLKVFTFLLAGSMFYDIIWMVNHSQNWFIRTVTIILLVLKVPTTFSFVTALQQRGGQFSGLGIRGNDLSGATVWSMPGGFTSGGREGYQNVDSPVDAPKPLSVPPSQPAQQSAVPNPGAYQSV
ncbi:hypothetical protein C2E23DRAFT_348203 [Lenzites betulinus]|nr:hypothetical protein C2E23DRAFT_348203 [Lenzites betulinus]